jgi:hypothetical protein
MDSLARRAPRQCQPHFCPNTIREIRIQSVTKDFQIHVSSASFEIMHIYVEHHTYFLELTKYKKMREFISLIP